MTPNNFRVKSGLTVGTTISGGNTTITGFVNATSSVNAASHTVGTSFVANTSRVSIGTAVGLEANGGIGTAGQVLHSNGTTIYWATDDQGVTSVAAANGLNGGTITSTGTISVLGGSTLTVNTTGVHVNTSNLSIATSQLTGDVALGTNTSGNYVATISNANGISGTSSTEGGTPTIGVVTGSTLTVNTTGVHVNSTLSLTDLTLSGNLTVSGTRTYVNTTTLDVGDNIITLNADLGASAPSQDAGIEIMRGTSANVQFLWDETNDRWSTNGQPLAVSSLIASGAASGITTLAAGNTTITGFVNATSSINAASHTVGTNWIANSTQVTHGVNTLINNNQHLRFQTVNSSAYAYFVQQNDDNFVFYTSNTTYGQRAVWSIFANSVSSTMRLDVPLYPIAGITANGVIGTAGQVLKSNGAGIFWDTAGGTGTVTSVATANGLTGGTITATGTLGVATGSTLTVNSTGIHVNSALSIDQVFTSNNGAGTNVRIGDDAWFGDVNVADTVRIMGQQSANNGYIVFGNADNSIKLGRAGTGALTWNGAFSVTGGLTTLSANLVMANNNITRPVLTGYTEHEVANAAVTGSYTMDCGAANFFDLTLTGNTTISPSNVPPSTRVWSGSIAAKQDATGGRTITWPSGTKYAGGVAPPATTTANALDIWSLMTYDGGTSWIVSLSVKGVA